MSETTDSRTGETRLCATLAEAQEMGVGLEWERDDDHDRFARWVGCLPPIAGCDVRAEMQVVDLTRFARKTKRLDLSPPISERRRMIELVLNAALSAHPTFEAALERAAADLPMMVVVQAAATEWAIYDGPEAAESGLPVGMIRLVGP